MRLMPHICFVVLCAAAIQSHAQFWQVTSGPAAAATCLATNSKGHVFAGTDYSKVYRTTDRGENWDFSDNGIDDGMNFVTISSIKVGANDDLYASVNGVGVLRSTDDGETWKKLAINLNVAPTARISVNTKVLPNGKTNIFVGYDDGPTQLHMRLSTNNGESFDTIPRSNLPGAASALFEVFQSPNSDKLFVLVAYNKGLYRSSNKGLSWTRIDSDPQSGESDDNFRVMNHDEKGHIYLGKNALPSSTKTKNAVVLKSTNDGESWTYLTQGWDNTEIINNRITGIAIGKSGEIWATTDKSSGPFHSTNYGATWSLVRDGLESADGSASGVVVTQANDVFVAIKGSFVHRHLDATSDVSETENGSSGLTTRPNPAFDQVALDLVSPIDGIAHVDVYSMSGASVLPSFSWPVVGGRGKTAMLNTDGLTPGAYTIVTRIGSQTLTKTFLKAN